MQNLGVAYAQALIFQLRALVLPSMRRLHGSERRLWIEVARKMMEQARDAPRHFLAVESICVARFTKCDPILQGQRMESREPSRAALRQLECREELLVGEAPVSHFVNRDLSHGSGAAKVTVDT